MILRTALQLKKLLRRRAVMEPEHHIKTARAAQRFRWSVIFMQRTIRSGVDLGLALSLSMNNQDTDESLSNPFGVAYPWYLTLFAVLFAFASLQSFIVMLSATRAPITAIGFTSAI